MFAKASILAAAAFLFLQVRVPAEIYIVTTTAEVGPGSLGQAILNANAHPNASPDDSDRIYFAIPGNDVQTIAPFSPFPDITDPVLIDGFTQEGAFHNTNPVGDGLNTTLRIELDGNNLRSYGHGLTVTCGNTTIRGLIINRFFFGILCVGGSGNLITGSFIGTDRTGSTAPIISSLLRDPRQLYGIVLQNCSNSRIGGLEPSSRNLLAGAWFGDVKITGITATGNVVEGNLMGMRATGMSALQWGSGFSVALEDGANGNLIGGTAAEARNVLSSSEGTGAFYVGVYFVPTTVINGFAAPFANLIKGNFFGLNVTGRGVIDSDDHPTGYGILLAGHHNVIGGTEPGARNIISGNRGGAILIGGNSDKEAANDNVIQGNYIGTDESGSRPLPNGRFTLELGSFANNNTIGGTEPGAGNRIAFTSRGVSTTIAAGSGILASDFPSGGGTGNAILGNLIYGNQSLGINLGFDGITPNDPGDTDIGPNKLQNYPVLTSAEFAGRNVHIHGTLESTPTRLFRIEFCGDSIPEAPMFAQGKVFLGAGSAMTNAGGTAEFDFSWPCPPGVRVVTSTATDPDGNTSEFSGALPITGMPAAQLLNISTRMRVDTGDNVLIGGFIITGIDPKKVLLRAIGPSLASSFTGVLSDPLLELYEGYDLLASNNNWRDTQEAEIQATGIAPTNDLESAIVATLWPGAYTAVMRGWQNATGLGLVEVYDLDQGVVSELANISTRGFVEAGDNVMIGGLIVEPVGGETAKVVVRAIGPSLTSFGIAGALQDPRLDLVNSDGMVIRSNNNWRDSQQAEIEAVGLQPTDDQESALIQVVAPGNYTAIVRGVGGTTGVAVVEVYHVQ